MPNEDFCAIDFETACPARASACAVGLARVRDGRVADTFYSLIKPPPGMEILPWFTAIHGIRGDQVASAPTFAQLWPRLRDFIGTDLLVAHNASFDRSVFRACLAHYGLDADAPDFACTVVRSRSVWPRLRDHKLNTVCAHLGIELNHHEALSDATACAQIYLEALRRTGI